ncbi:hypothetical protein LWI28_028336 [Acer negundo]|uniref:Myb/SANT-like domain-containing protein n=1 Tax=Acer negundo TaxID=4023 RepID=A0AAD5IKQ1_ACENE|nr:hypothetical protein LWI28_028336 [Acer negundo]
MLAPRGPLGSAAADIWLPFSWCLDLSDLVFNCFAAWTWLLGHVFFIWISSVVLAVWAYRSSSGICCGVFILIRFSSHTHIHTDTSRLSSICQQPAARRLSSSICYLQSFVFYSPSRRRLTRSSSRRLTRLSLPSAHSIVITHSFVRRRSLLQLTIKDGARCDPGSFKAGTMTQIEKTLTTMLPDSRLRANPHIDSKMRLWKKEYGILYDMLNVSGFGWNDIKKCVEVDSNDVWEVAWPQRASNFAWAHAAQAAQRSRLGPSSTVFGEGGRCER